MLSGNLRNAVFHKVTLLASIALLCAPFWSSTSGIFANLPTYLSQDLERIQRHALAVLYSPYSLNALTRVGILTHQERRNNSMTKFVQKVSSENPLHPLIHKTTISQSSNYNLRPKPNATLATKTNHFGNFACVKYVSAV